MSVYLFVYGTLLKDSASEMAKYLSVHSRVVSEAWFPGTLFRIDWYPGAVYNVSAPGRVWGIVVEVDDPVAVFGVLDAYEEVGERFPQPNEYVRLVVSVQAPDGQELDAWVYLYNHPWAHFPVIESGRFV